MRPPSCGALPQCRAPPPRVTKRSVACSLKRARGHARGHTRRERAFRVLSGLEVKQNDREYHHPLTGDWFYSIEFALDILSIIYDQNSLTYLHQLACSIFQSQTVTLTFTCPCCLVSPGHPIRKQPVSTAYRHTKICQNIVNRQKKTKKNTIPIRT